MSAPLVRAVFDCNLYFQALINEEGPAGRCVTTAFERKVGLFLCRQVLTEVRRTATDPILRVKFQQITDERLAQLIANVEKVGHVVTRIPERFTYPRDPDDAHYINLALAAKARYVVTRDKDPLDLMDAARPEGPEFRQRFRSLQIIEPQVLLRELARTEA